ncbi:CoA transferase [Mangrovimicrobium sediminis]|uniref:CoA transferase n=1 Tax=Mangrovimicrobium sediminis TaxID=2562682 RepID=A0A4Z0M113_9GAMM|nr:CaiB/BaiF CoA-transferase family protein [Haliea sp. SAOS-164]TGD73373.1 CoA transferase [Haliea sp. SAOS-164]
MGALSGYRVIELAGIGPCPMAGMLLADMGADVICVDRSHRRDPLYARDMSRRGKKSMVVDLKTPQGRDLLLELVATADVLLEGFRPGVAEKLGIGPADCAAMNPALVYGRMTGWGQEGPLAHSAGHDINYIALSGALHAVGPADGKPVVPLNLVGDFGGGSLFLVTGVLAALLEARASGRGQVVDAAMVDGAANLMWMCHSFHAAGFWDLSRRGVNTLDGGAFFYDTYATADGEYIALGAIEPQFYAQLLELAGLDPARFRAEEQMDATQWSRLREELAAVFLRKTRAQWCELLEGSDACFSPVLSALEAPAHPHNRARNAYLEVDGFPQPAPAPRFSRTASQVAHGQRLPGADTRDILHGLGLVDADIHALARDGVIHCTDHYTSHSKSPPERSAGGKETP